MSAILTIAGLAGEQYANRVRRAREQVAAGKVERDVAERALRPWLAIACRCGAQLPELARDIAEAAGGPGETVVIGEGLARAIVADRIAPRRSWAPLLAAARDKALEASREGDPETVRAAYALSRLADHLAHDVNGNHPIPPFQSKIAQEKAA